MNGSGGHTTRIRINKPAIVRFTGREGKGGRIAGFAAAESPGTPDCGQGLTQPNRIRAHQILYIYTVLFTAQKDAVK